MPLSENFEELDLTGMDIDSVPWSGDKIVRRLGAGYRVSAVVSPPSGLHRWVLSSGCLPDDPGYGMIDGKSRFEYYYEFFKRHTTGPREEFVIDWRGKKWTAAFSEPQITFERFTDDLYAGGGVPVEQCRVKGVYYEEDGSVFDPLLVEGLAAWWFPEGSVWTGEDHSGNDRDLEGELPGPSIELNNGVRVFRFESGALNPLVCGATFDITHGFVLACYNDPVFPNDWQGLLTSVDTPILVADLETTTWTDFSYGAGFTYKKNGTAYPNNNLQAPMNGELGVMEFTFADELVQVVVGRDRGFGDRIFQPSDIAEIILINNAAITGEMLTKIRNYLAFRGKVTLD